VSSNQSAQRDSGLVPDSLGQFSNKPFVQGKADGLLSCSGVKRYGDRMDEEIAEIALHARGRNSVPLRRHFDGKILHLSTRNLGATWEQNPVFLALRGKAKSQKSKADHSLDLARKILSRQRSRVRVPSSPPFFFQLPARNACPPRTFERRPLKARQVFIALLPAQCARY